MAVTTSGSLPDEVYDIVVIGAGVVGTAIARELACYPLRIALVEASDDVGEGTSKANTAILHTGFDAVPGSLESRLVREGQRLLAAYAAEAGIPVEPVGALLVAWDDEQLGALPRLVEKAERNGYRETRIIGADELYAREPRLGPGALGALDVPGESVICPWTTTLAYATQAVRRRRRSASQLRGEAGRRRIPHELATVRGPLRTHTLINAAGLRADEIDRMLGHADFTVRPWRGQLMVFDKFARDLVRHILLPVPTALGKGCWWHRRSTAMCCSGRPPRTWRTRRRPAPPRRGWPFCASGAGASCPRCSTRRSPPSTRGCARPPRTTTTRSATIPSSGI